MAKFKTADGTEWTARCRLSTIAKVKEDCGVDIVPSSEEGDVDVNSAANKLNENPMLLLDIVALYCIDDIEEKGMSVDEAKDIFDLGPLNPMVDAFREATQQFVEGGTRPTQAKAKDKS